ncbi:glycosyltransferase family 87 protein [Haliangium sp.]|uniref:glycosyltransferase family 87 protein n=1 Tax=Haliangium sp. TaxID=2663208 RepID=UPI003D0ADAB0
MSHGEARDGPRLVVGYGVAATGSVALTVAVAGALGPAPATTVQALAIALVAALVPAAPALARRRGMAAATVAIAAVAVALVLGVALAGATRQLALVLAPVPAAALEPVLIPRLLRRLPSFERSLRGARATRWLWLALGALFVLQWLHLGAFMLAPDFRLGSALPFYGASHTCLPAYLRAAELSQRDPGALYHRDQYLADAARAPDAGAAAGMAEYANDPYHYPPPFAMVPGALRQLSDDFMRLRALWFGLSALALLALMVAICARLDAPAAWPAAALALASVNTLYTLQYGQVHFAVMAAAVAAMFAFEARRHPLGGALLAFAVATKLFPGVFVVVLIARRAWRALAWTAAMGALFVAVSALVYGLAPYQAFFAEQLPRLLDGRAFQIFAADDEFLISNLGFGSVLHKFDVLVGLPAQALLTRVVTGAYLLLLLGLAAVVARRSAPRPEAQLTRLLALLCLASMVGAYNPASYGMAPLLWLGAAILVACPPTRGWHWAAAAGLWVFWQLTPVMGSLPVLWRLTWLHVPVALAAQLSVIALAAWPLLSARFMAVPAPASRSAGTGLEE